MKIIVEDTSFLISVFHTQESFHENSVNLMTEILARKNKARVIVPSIAFFETIFNLVRIGIPRSEIEKKLWDFLYNDQIFNIGLIETSAFRLFKKFPPEKLCGFKTGDYLIASTALAFDALILTYDKKMRKNIGSIYKKIYYCNPDDPDFSGDRDKFLTELKDC